MLPHESHEHPVVITISDCHALVCRSRHLPNGTITYDCALNAADLETEAIALLIADDQPCLLGEYYPCPPKLAAQAIWAEHPSTTPAGDAPSPEQSNALTADILIVGDDVAGLERLQAMVRGSGYTVLTQTPSSLDMAELARLNPQLMILHWQIEQPDQGWQTFKWLKFHPPIAHIPLLVCAAATTWVQEVEGFLRSQDVVVVYEPVQLGELRSAITLALEDGRLAWAQGPDGDG